MNKPRLLVLTSTFPRWSDDHEPPFVFELARRLTQKFEVTVLAPHAPGSKTQELMDGVRVQRFRYGPDSLEKLAYEGGIPHKLRNQPWLWLLVPVFLLAQLFASWRLIRQMEPDVVHAHWLLPQGLLGLLACRLSGAHCRFVVTAHGADIHGLGSGLATRLKRWVIDRADALTVVSRDLASRANKLSSDDSKIHVLPMGVDLTTRFVPSPERTPGQTLIFAGRLVEKKGVACLLDAMAMVAEDYPACRLRIAGTGPLLQPLQIQARQLGVLDRVEFLGNYQNQDLPGIFQSADIAVFPFQRAAGGDQEGLGLVMLEAMGCGLPVVAGNLPAIHDVIEHQRTGLLVAPQDPTALAGAIRRLLVDQAFARELAIAGRQFAQQHFDWRVIAQRYDRLLLRSVAELP